MRSPTHVSLLHQWRVPPLVLCTMRVQCLRLIVMGARLRSHAGPSTGKSKSTTRIGL
jgi:hypothetical protein